MMFRKLLLLTGGVIFACGTTAWAGTQNYTELSAFGGPGLVSVAAPASNTATSGGVTGVSSFAGATYMNTYFQAGTGLTAGNEFKSIGSFLISSYQPQNLPPSSTSGVGGQVVAVFALQGQITSSGPSLGLNFNQGVINYYNLPIGGYTPNSLATWGINPANLVGSYILKNPGVPGNSFETVAVGNPSAYLSTKTGVPANQVSFVGIPNGALGSATGGALFRDAFSTPTLSGTPIADIFDPAGNSLAPSYGRTINGTGTGTNSFYVPGFIGDFTETFQNANNLAFQIGLSDIVIANNFFTTAFNSASSLTLPDGTVLPGAPLLEDGGFGFATGLGAGSVTNYNPDLSSGSSTTGDLAASSTSGNQFAPTLEPVIVTLRGVPEPTSMLLVGLGLAGAGLVRYMRRRK